MNISQALSKTNQKRKPSTLWYLSYSDLVTTLLCFFIIFYILEKRLEKKLVAGSYLGENKLYEHKSDTVDSVMSFATNILKKMPGINVEKTSSFLDVNFEDKMFFKKGQVSLTSNGELVLKEFFDRISSVQDSFYLEIQGHADSTPVKKNQKRWWTNNTELSVLRSLAVHNFLKEYKPDFKNKVIVSGYGSENLKEMDTNQLKYQRRVSIRLHLIKEQL